jgi:hydrophobe/amphiphile efflux-3 (HAE3) family protein
MRNLLARIAGWAVEHPVPTVTAAVLMTLIGSIAALRLEANAGTDTLVDTGSNTYAATQSFNQRFGEDAVVVLVQGDMSQVLLSSDLGRMLALESCLSGTAPGGEVIKGQPAKPACAAIAELKPSFVVYGPATFLNQSAIQARNLLSQQVAATRAQERAAAKQAAQQAAQQGATPAQQRQAAAAAAQQVQTQFQQQLVGLALQYGITSVPALDDPNYVQSVIFDSRLAGGVPKARFFDLVPSPDAALISVRLRPELTEQQRQQAVSLFRAAVDQFQADPNLRLRDATYTVTGPLPVVEGLAQELSTQVFILLAVALAVMAITLSVVFRPPLRLLPLGVALGAAGIAFGFLSLAGGSLTMASIAVLPVLIGLAVDYAIQFQARFGERLDAGSSPARAAVEAAAAGGPVIATACLATVAGFLVLLLSPIPMVRGFGVLLVVGIAIAFCLAITAGLATLSLSKSGTAPMRMPARLRPIRERLPGRPQWPERLSLNALALSIRAPGRVLLVAAVLAVLGWVAGTRVNVISDIRELVPSDLPALSDVDRLEAATGVSGRFYVAVSAPDLTSPAVITWMKDYEQRVLSSHGFTGDFPSCRDEGTEICPALSLPDVFGDATSIPSRERIRAVLNLLPQYFSQAVIDRDPETGKLGHTGVIAFWIKVMPFDQQEQLIDDVRAAINPPGAENDPPPGVTAQVVGLPVLAADANSALSGSRYLMSVAAILAVALVLLAVYRSLRRALVPLIPIVLATGWSSLVLWATGVPLNPMSATLGALVIAIATEFSVLLSARYHEERAAGGTVGEALRRAYTRTGAAVAASGVTAIAGFAVLALASPIEAVLGGNAVRMLTDFGLVTVFDLAIALAGVMLVLPAALVWAEGGLARLPALSRARRRGRTAPDVA